MLTEELFAGYVLTCTSSFSPALMLVCDAYASMPRRRCHPSSYLVVVANDCGQQPVGRSRFCVLGEVRSDRERETGSTDWLLTKVVRHDDEIYELDGIAGEASRCTRRTPASRRARELDVHVSTYPVNKYSVNIYRMGYYGGNGARLMRTLGPLQGTPEPTPQDGERHLVECNWKVGFSLKIPKDWVSGVYLGRLTTLPAPADKP